MKILNNSILIIALFSASVCKPQVQDAVYAAQDAEGKSLCDLKREIRATKTRSLPLNVDTNFDSFIDEADYNAVDAKVLNLNNIIYHNFNKDIHSYKAIASYRIEFSEDFYSIVVTVIKGNDIMQSILINYSLDGDFIDSILVANDELTANTSRTTTKITQRTLTRSHSFIEGQEERIEQSVYKIDTDGTIKELSSEEVLIDKVIRQLGLEYKKVNTHLLAAKVNPSNTQETILVIPEFAVNDEKEMYFEFNSHIVLVNNVTGNITHTYFESSKTNGWVSDAVLLAEINIDTAPYKVTKSSRAFGVTLYRYNQSQPNPYSNKTISLFVKSGNTLKKVLHNYDVLYYGGEWDTNCAGEFTEEKKILIISEKLTNGFFEITVKNTRTHSVDYLAENGDCESEKEVTHNKTSLKFDGKTYQSN